MLAFSVLFSHTLISEAAAAEAGCQNAWRDICECVYMDPKSPPRWGWGVPPPPVEMVLLMACTITACSRVGCRKEMRKEGTERSTGKGSKRREKGGGRGLGGGYSNSVCVYRCVGTSPSSALPPPLICQVNAIMHWDWIYFWVMLCMYTQLIRTTSQALFLNSSRFTGMLLQVYYIVYFAGYSSRAMFVPLSMASSCIDKKNKISGTAGIEAEWRVMIGKSLEVQPLLL